MADGITQAGPAGASPVKATLASNYIDFTSGSDAAGINDWRQQYLPELMEKEAEIFGNRTVGGFLEMVGAEEQQHQTQLFGLSKSAYTLSTQVRLREIKLTLTV